MDGLNIADVYIIGILLISALISIYRGFLREFITVVSWVIAGTLAFWLGPKLGLHIGFIDSDIGKHIFGGIIVFIASLSLLYLAKFLLFRALKISGVSKLDRGLGALFGLLRGAVLIVAVILAATDPIKEQKWYKQSYLIAKFDVVAEAIAKATPDSFKKELKEEMDEIRKKETELIHDAVQKEKDKKQGENTDVDDKKLEEIIQKAMQQPADPKKP